MYTALTPTDVHFSIIIIPKMDRNDYSTSGQIYYTRVVTLIYP